MSGRATTLTLHSWRSAFRVTGEDRHEYLHRMLTCRVLDRAAGERVHGLLLDTKGRVLADLDLWVLDDEILGLGDGPAIPGAVSALQRTILRRDVAVEDLSGLRVVWRLDGERGQIDAMGEAAGVRRTEIADCPVIVARGGSLPGLDVLAPVAHAERVGESIRARSNAVVGDRDAWERRRIELGLVATGSETTGAELPQEARLDDALDFDKGCYPGQETVARVHYRGHVNRLLARLRSASPIGPGQRLLRGGREAGSVTSVAATASGWIALGYLRREALEADSELTTDTGAPVQVWSGPWGDETGARQGSEP